MQLNQKNICCENYTKLIKYLKLIQKIQIDNIFFCAAFNVTGYAFYIWPKFKYY